MSQQSHLQRAGVLLAITLLPCACARFDIGGIDVDANADVDAAFDETDAAVVIDASVYDAPPDAMQCWTWTPAHFDPCALPAPKDALLITADHIYDTDALDFITPDPPPAPPTLVVDQEDGTEAVVLSVTSLTIGLQSELRFIGSRPVIVAASEEIYVGGTLTVSSTLGGGAGAGANYGDCLAAEPGDPDAGGGGGGGGGGFQGAGGAGGPGDANDNNGDGISSGGAGGAAVAIPITVRGGCPGAMGGEADGNPAPGGDGGGAIHLASQGLLSVDGGIIAGGSGGPSGPLMRNGGSGAGSGGYIGLDAPEISLLSAILAANGGGGGEGGLINSDTTPGSDGGASEVPALGGDGGAMFEQAGNGGNGGAGMTIDGETATDFREGGGGGGGGGVGYIIFRTAEVNGAAAVLSPAATEVNP